MTSPNSCYTLTGDYVLVRSTLSPGLALPVIFFTSLGNEDDVEAVTRDPQ